MSLSSSEPLAAHVATSGVSNGVAASHNTYFEAMFESNPQPMWIYDQLSLRFLAVNQAAQDVYGYSHEQFLSMTLYDIRPVETHDSLTRVVQDSRDKARGVARAVHQTRAGALIEVEVRGSRLDYEGRDARYVVINNVTETVQAERKLLETVNTLRSTLEATVHGILLIRNDGHPELFNERFRAIWKLPEDVSPYGRHSLLDTLAESMLDPDVLLEAAALPMTETYHGEWMLREDRTVVVDAYPNYLDGTLYGQVWTFADVTEQRRMQWQLRESESRFRNVAENLGEAIVITDLDDRMLYVNRVMEHLTGYTREELLGQVSYRLLMTPEHWASIKERSRERADGKSEHYDMELRRKDGSTVWTQISATPYYDHTGMVIGSIAALIDLTERRRIEQELAEAALFARKSEANLSAVIENADGTIYAIDADARLLVFNQAWSRAVSAIVGRAPQIGERLPDYFGNDRHGSEGWKQLHLRALSGERYTYEHENPNRSGQWLEHSYNPIVEDGRVLAVVVLSRDVTERKEYERSLNEASEQVRRTAEESRVTAQNLRAILENSNDIIYSLDRDLRLVCYNSACERMCQHYGMTPAVGASIDELFVGSPQREEWKEYIHRGLRGERFTFEKPSDRESEQWFEASINPLRSSDHDPAVEGVVVVVKDVTQRKQYEAELLHSEANLAALIENTSDIIYSVDCNYRIRAFNSAFRETSKRLRGIEPIIGGDIREYLLAEGNTNVETNYIRAFTGEQFRVERLVELDDSPEWFEISYNPILDSDGTVSGCVVFGRNVSERRELETQLRAAKDRAEEMNRLKSSFLANMSHEIRTPVTSILGFASLISEETADEHLRYYASTVERSGKRLLDTINGILDLAKVEANKLDYHAVAIDLETEIHSALQIIDSVVQSKGLTASLRRQAELRVYVEADPHYLGQILLNLLGNAAKFTDEGSICVELAVENRRAIVRVIDTGVGISPDFLPFVFDEFKQESAGYERKFEGSGLGLTISQRLAAMMGGTLTAQSTPGVGSTFILSLPLHSTTMLEHSDIHPGSLPPAQEGLPPGQKPRILLVEDTYETAEMIKLFLRTIGEVEHAVDGQSALEHTRAQESGFDVVLMDINLGRGMSGLDVTRELRKDQRYSIAPIIALTAYAMKGDREQMLAAGCTDYLSKPFSKKELLEVLSRYIAA